MKALDFSSIFLHKSPDSTGARTVHVFIIFQPEEVREQIYTDGCIRGLGYWLEQNALIVGIACIVALIPQVRASFLS